jgi:triphosphatase
MLDGSEIELKFLFAERDGAKVKALVAAASGALQATRQRLRTIYFDTPNQDLRNHGFAVRVWAIGQKHVQTVKRIAYEWEAQTARSELDLERIKNTPSRVSPANLPFAAH